MAYSTLEDLLAMITASELAELTTESGDDPDPEVVSQAITKADAEIDAYLGIVYEVPFSPVPLLIKSLSVDLALYHLYSRRSVAPAVRRQRYEAALAFLKGVASGQAVLPGVGGILVTQISSADRRFSRETLEDW